MLRTIGKLIIITLVINYGLIAFVANAHILNHLQSNRVYRSDAACSYPTCTPTKPGALNVHIICHTHLDTGWVETYQEYYDRYVRYILNSLVDNLQKHPSRKFMFVEVSYFAKWYQEQPSNIKSTVHRLVESGQLEFISGGWSMNDEATAHYKDIIDDLTLGHQWLNQTFGRCSRQKIGWQIDPFGHSREHASILGQMGFDGLFLGRIDYQDKLEREHNRQLEFIWKTSPSLGRRNDLFTSVLPNIYWPPSGFCFDVNCFDEEITSENGARRARDFIATVKQQSAHYATNHTVITMGMDFYYRNAGKWFDNLDRLMSYVNQQSDSNVNIIYSTPSCYLNALNSEKKQWPVKIDDFLPYADELNAYWTGYYTSRPALKFLIRSASNQLTVAKQLCVTSWMSPSYCLARLTPLKEAEAIVQHHDAVTGTCKQYVANDYVKMLSSGIAHAQQLIAESLERLLGANRQFEWLHAGDGRVPKLRFCDTLNVSRCAQSENLAFNDAHNLLVLAYNPIAHPIKHYIRLPVGATLGSYFVRNNADGQYIRSQIAPIPHQQMTSGQPNTRSIYPTNEIVFKAMLPALGFSTFTIENNQVAIQRTGAALNYQATGSLVQTSSDQSHNTVNNQAGSGHKKADFFISNEQFQLNFDGRTGLIKSMQLLANTGVYSQQQQSQYSTLAAIPVTQNFYMYRSKGRYGPGKPSGAYRFSPIDDELRPVVNQTVSYRVYHGIHADEVHQQFNPWISQVIRVYKSVPYIEFDWQVGPIPLESWHLNGYEIVSRFDTALRSNGTFFTDSNGRETLRRVRNHRSTFSLYTTERYSSNYYPVTSWAFIRDHSLGTQLTVLVDRAQGGSSTSDGSLELMVHRRLLHDDAYGMDEALNEPGENGENGLVVRGRHRLLINTIQESVRQMRILAKTLTTRPLLAFSELAKPIQPPIVASPPAQSGHQPISGFIQPSLYSGLARRLPANVHLLSLEPWDSDYILLRLEHFFEINEDVKFSVPKRIQLSDLFNDFLITDVRETTLNAMELKSVAEVQRKQFVAQFDPYANYTNMLTTNDDADPVDETYLTNDVINVSRRNVNTSLKSYVVLLHPMEIRTFLIKGYKP